VNYLHNDVFKIKGIFFRKKLLLNHFKKPSKVLGVELGGTVLE
jgi:hypothetical protein